MEFRFVPFTISIVVAVVLFATMLLPIIGDATATEKTFDNSASARYQMKELEVGDRWERTSQVWYYNDEFVSDYKTYEYGIIFTDNLTLREIGSLKGTSVSTGGNTITSAESVTVDDGEGLLFNDTGTAFTYTYGYGAVPQGDLIMKTRESSAYVLSDTVMYITGMTQLVSGSDNSQVIVAIYGSINDGFTVAVNPVSNGTASDISIGEITVNATPVEECVDLYLFTGISFDINATYGGDSVTVNAIYSSFVMPKMVTAELSQHLDDTERTLVGIIPLLVIIGLVIGVVAFVAVRSERF